MENYVLGLDVSTSTIGAAIIDPETNELKGLFYVPLKKEKGFINKIKLVKAELHKYEGMIGHVAIEEPLKRFKKGQSSAHVISILGQFNGMVQLLSFLLYNVTPMMYNVGTARSVALPELKFPHGSNRKQLIQEQIALEYPDVDWPFCPKAHNPDGTPRLKDECFDMSDAVVVAMCHIEMMKRGENESNS